MKSKMKLRILGFALLCGLFLLLAAGCGGQSGRSNAVDKDGKMIVRVGYFPNVTHAQALVGFSDGTFQKAMGDSVKIIESTFNAGPAEIEALLAGEIDLGYIGPVPAINGFVRSRGGLRIIAGAADGGAVLVARKDADIKTVKDLNGKTVAIPQLGNTQDISLRNLLASVDLKDAAKGGTVTVIPAENADILTLISKGEVDAALVPEPWGSRIIKQASAVVVLDSNEVWRDGKYATSVLIVSTNFLNEHPDLVEKWLNAHVDITERINHEKDKSKNMINSMIKKLTKKSLPDDVITSSLNRITITNNPEKDSIEEFVQISVDNGYIKDQPDVSDLVDLTLINKVLSKKGLQILQ
ncbi:MAG TPA: aliphatic sulfonate ABC transporter substrate-binding protein [Desulfobacteria bacterium]|nr:aliphatic sulfonate ABC transporter substrate-binding protein [Desulfobacteria bacterium]